MIGNVSSSRVRMTFRVSVKAGIHSSVRARVTRRPGCVRPLAGRRGSRRPGRALAIRKLEEGLAAGQVEEPHPAADDEWERHDPGLIDQVVLFQLRIPRPDPASTDPSVA